MIAVLRRLRPRPAPTSIALPKVWCGEDGEDYWALGHIEPYRMVLAAVVENLLDVGTEETVELLFSADLILARAARTRSRLHVAKIVAGVSHEWWADVYEEQWRACTASDPDAWPITRMPCW